MASIMLSLNGSLTERYTLWQAVLALAHYAAAAAVLGTAGTGGWEVPVVVRFNIWTSSDGTCTGSGGCTISEFERQLEHSIMTGALVASFSFISGTHHLLGVLWGSLYEESYVEHIANDRGVSVLRWVDYMFSASLMLMLDSILYVAPPSTQQLVLTFCVMFVVVVAGYGSEVAWACGSTGHAKAIYLSALAPFVAVWGVTWSIFGEGLHPGNNAYGIKAAFNMTPGVDSSKPPDFVYAILGLLFGTYCTFPAVHAYRVWKTEPPTSVDGVIATEAMYGYLSFLAKIPLLSVYASAISARESSVTVAGRYPSSATEPGNTSDDGTFTALGVSLVVSLLLGVAMWRNLRAAPTSISGEPPATKSNNAQIAESTVKLL